MAKILNLVMDISKMALFFGIIAEYCENSTIKLLIQRSFPLKDFRQNMKLQIQLQQNYIKTSKYLLLFING